MAMSDGVAKNAQAGREPGDRTRANRGTQAWQLSPDVHGAARGLKEGETIKGTLVFEDG